MIALCKQHIQEGSVEPQIPSDCLNWQATGAARLEVEAEDSVPLCPLGRVPHVCIGAAGALHGLNKMGEAPSAVVFSVQRNRRTEGPSRAQPNDAKPICGSTDPSWVCFFREIYCGSA